MIEALWRLECAAQLLEVLVPVRRDVQHSGIADQVREVQRSLLGQAVALIHNGEHRTADDRGLDERARVHTYNRR
jgi:hypothetical protein